MSRQRRHIVSNSLYEITFRAKDSLPLVCTRYMSLLIYSVLARVQRNHKVILHHYIFEGSHCHIICTAKDANECQAFYGELQKQLTEAIKRLLGLENLSIWEGRPSVIRLPTLDDAMLKIGYIYANPSNDDIESSIDLYPGVSSWESYLCANSLDSCATSIHPWIRQPMVPKLPSRSVTSRQDEEICRKMLSAARKTHVLYVYPLAWIKHFIENASAAEIASITKGINDNLRAREAENSRRRAASGKRVLGAQKLKTQPLLKPHTPKKKERKIFVQSIHKEVRLGIIEEMKQINILCRRVYEKWKSRDFTDIWPPGCFPPPLPRQANAIEL